MSEVQVLLGEVIDGVTCHSLLRCDVCMILKGWL